MLIAGKWLPINRFQRAPTHLGGKIGRPIDAICGNSTNMVGCPAGLGKNDENVLQRLLELRDQVLAMEPLLIVPADLTGDEHHASGGDDDSVGVSDRGSPTLRKQYRHRPPRFEAPMTLRRRRLYAMHSHAHPSAAAWRYLPSDPSNQSPPALKSRAMSGSTACRHQPQYGMPGADKQTGRSTRCFQ